MLIEESMSTKLRVFTNGNHRCGTLRPTVVPISTVATGCYLLPDIAFPSSRGWVAGSHSGCWCCAEQEWRNPVLSVPSNGLHYHHWPKCSWIKLSHACTIHLQTSQEQDIQNTQVESPFREIAKNKTKRALFWYGYLPLTGQDWTLHNDLVSAEPQN